MVKIIFPFFHILISCKKNIDIINNKPTESDEIQAEEVCEDFSMLMNQALVWYLFFNLPGIYTKNLSSEQGTLLEKFKNCCKVGHFFVYLINLD